ncbi:MAG: 2-C-methyl-D-erythritol 4-phosphate cytidylyltransferase [Ruminococcus sp.]|jgi:2-C-methyl-D-erythritol 4-phosphate cytidylyltransferase|nr:2-C-methyl-D-erythritol 4-phosphate cytidylyltransferase [Ruminococcus sp.]
MSVSVILACGGSSSRLGFDKQLYELRGIPVFIRAIRNFEVIDEILEIIIAAPEKLISNFDEILSKFDIKKPIKVIAGGKNRTESVINAYKFCDKNARLIAVSDGARPFTNPEFIRACIKDANIFGASVLGVNVKDTIKIADGDMIIDTPDRRKLFAVQTPQIFSREYFVRGVQFAVDHDLDFTDDAAMLEAVGIKAHITISDYKNIKITTPEDIIIAAAFAEEYDV